MDTNTPPLLQWNAPIQPHIVRGHTWYVAAATVVLGTAAYGILANSWPLAVVAVLCGALYFILRDHKPREITITLYEPGLLHDGTFHRWDEFAGFWILQTPDYNEIHLCSASRRKKDLIVQLGGLSPDSARMACGSFLTELSDRKETLIDIFSRLAKL